MTTAVRRRRAERRGAAVVRAVGAEPSADLRGGSLLVGGRRVGLASPHLAADLGEISDAQARGIADSLGLLVRHSDLDLHRDRGIVEPDGAVHQLEDRIAPFIGAAVLGARRHPPHRIGCEAFPDIGSSRCHQLEVLAHPLFVVLDVLSVLKNTERKTKFF